MAKTEGNDHLAHSLSRDLTHAEITNAQLPQDIWEEILWYIYGIPVCLYLELICTSLERESEVCSVKWTCRALHQWVQRRQWKEIWLTQISQFDALLLRVRLEPGALRFVKIFRVSPFWAWSSHYAHDWEVCGAPEEWYFADRDARKVEWVTKHMVLPEIADFYEIDRDFIRTELFDGGDQRIEGWGHGPESDGEIEGFMDALSIRDTLEKLLLQMPSLQVFHYGTQFIPMTERMCKFLGGLKDLQVLSIGPSGEFFTPSLSLSPLWLIFEGRSQDNPLQCLFLNIEVLPSAYEFKTAREYFKEDVPEFLNVLQDTHTDEQAPFSLPDPSRWVGYERSDNDVEPTLSFVERPLAMLYRTLQAARGKLRQVQTTEKGLARIIDYLPLWSQVAFLAHDYHLHRATNWEEDPYADALLSLQDGLRNCARGHPESQECPKEDAFLKMCDMPALGPLKGMVQGRRHLQEKMWTMFQEGERRRLPDWDRPRTKSGRGIENSISMYGEEYVRGWPERNPEPTDWRFFDGWEEIRNEREEQEQRGQQSQSTDNLGGHDREEADMVP